MPIDPSIPLQARGPDLPTPQQMISLQNLVQQGQAQRIEMAQAIKAQRDQYAAQQIVSAPGATDESGLYTLDTIRSLGKVNYELGQKAAGQRERELLSLQSLKNQQLQAALNEQLLTQNLEKSQKEVMERAVVKADLLPPDTPLSEKDRTVREEIQKGLEDQKKSGRYPYTDQMWQNLQAHPYTYADIKARITLPKELAAAKKEEALEKRGEEDPFMKESNRLDWLEQHGQSKSAEAQRLRKHLEKMDAPPISLAGVGALQPDTLRLAAEQYLAGDKSAAMGYGRSAPMRAALQNEIAKVAKERGMSGADIAAMTAQYQGMQAGERTLGQRTANIEMAVTEAQQMAPLALTASRAVDRTKYPTLNKLLLAAERGTGDENVVRLGVATNSLINIYARAISPTGVPTVSDKDHARELLEAAWSKGQYAAGIDQLMKELQAARRSPGMVREEMRGAIAAPPGKAPQQTPYQGPKVTAPKPYDDPEKERRYQKWKQEHGYQ